MTGQVRGHLLSLEQKPDYPHSFFRNAFLFIEISLYFLELDVLEYVFNIEKVILNLMQILFGILFLYPCAIVFDFL